MLLLLKSLLKKCSKEKNNIKEEKTCILADIGGTNSRLFFCRVDHNNKFTTIYNYKYKSQEASCFESVLYDFVNKREVKCHSKPEICVIALAGPVQDQKTCILSNLPHWPEINSQQLEEKMKIKKVVLLNDFEAVGYSMLSDEIQNQSYLINSEYFENNKVIKNRSISVFGPGTGLGTCMLNYDKGQKMYDVMSSEGGHVQFSCLDQFDWDYKQSLTKNTNQDYISAEQAFCGRAIQDIFNFILNKQMIDSYQLSNEEIVEKGIKNSDQICRQVVDFMIKMFAIEVSNIAVRNLSFSGVFIVGNIISSLKDYLLQNKDQLFMKYYLNKPQLNYILQKIPIYILDRDDLGILGTQVVAIRLLKK